MICQEGLRTQQKRLMTQKKELMQHNKGLLTQYGRLMTCRDGAYDVLGGFEDKRGRANDSAERTDSMQ